MDNELLERFVALMADDLELSPDWLQKWLEIYYRLRRAQEKAEEELKLLIYPTMDAEDLSEAISRAAVRPSPADAFIRSVAEPPEAEAPPPAAEEPETGEEPAAAELAGFEAVEVKTEGLRGAAARKFKRDQRMRLDEIRRRGVSLQNLAVASDGKLTIKDLLSVLECANVEFSIYKALKATLDKFESES